MRQTAEPPQVPEADRRVGISVYSTDYPGTGGSIRESSEDFAVSEVLSPEAHLRIKEESGYAVYLLKKTGIDTNHAVKQVSHKTGLRLKVLGLKDAKAVTIQYACANSKSGSIPEWSSEKISLKRIGFVRKPLSKGEMAGNRFSIRIADAGPGLSEFDGFDRILNFFGHQRFGSKRAVSHLIGKAMVCGDFGKAARLLLSFTSEYDTAERNCIRAKLADESNYSKMYEQIPPGMDLERTVLSEMVRHGEPRRAIGAIPVAMRRFFVQAYQSFLFNLTLSRSLKEEDLFSPQKGDVCFDGAGKLGKYSDGSGQRLAIPLVGYGYYKKTRFHGAVSKVIESEGVAPRDFFIKDMQEASSEGGFRHAAVSCSDVSVCDDTVGFTLGRGSFATTVLREIIKPSDPFGCGF